MLQVQNDEHWLEYPSTLHLIELKIQQLELNRYQQLCCIIVLPLKEQFTPPQETQRYLSAFNL